MKIQFRQSGGYAGLIRGCDLDTSTLSKSEATQIEQLASAAQATAPTSSGADLTCYEIEITDGRRKKSLTLDDMSLTEETAPLVELLAQHAKPLPLKSAGKKSKP